MLKLFAVGFAILHGCIFLFIAIWLLRLKDYHRYPVDILEYRRSPLPDVNGLFYVNVRYRYTVDGEVVDGNTIDYLKQHMFRHSRVLEFDEFISKNDKYCYVSKKDKKNSFLFLPPLTIYILPILLLIPPAIIGFWIL